MYNNINFDEVGSFKYLGMAFNEPEIEVQHIFIKQALKDKATLECHMNKHNYMFTFCDVSVTLQNDLCKARLPRKMGC